jgi:hypothetical protein
MFGGFILGAIAGGALVWFYGREIRDYIDSKTERARSRAADTLGAAAGSLEAAKKRVEAGFGSHETRYDEETGSRWPS